MSSRSAHARSVVVSLAAEREIRRPRDAESAHASGTNSKHEIVIISNTLEGDLSPIVPEVRTSKSTPKKPRKRSTPKPQTDEQYSIEQIGAVIRGMSNKELKARFPIAHQKHDSLKRKTRTKTSWDQLHPVFEKFPDFLRHVGPAPHPDSSLERPDINNPVYGPGLCHWASPEEQANNRSTSVWIDWCGERHTLAQWAKLSDIKAGTLNKRHQRRWTEAEMFADAPVRRYRTPSAPLTPPPLPTPAGIFTYSLAHGKIPTMPADGWPADFSEARQFEAGFRHATRRKGHRVSMSRAHFGAWVAGSKLHFLRRQIVAAGLSGYIIPIARSLVPPEDIAEFDRRACACPAIREYFKLKLFELCFVSTYQAEEEEKSLRGRYRSTNPRETARVHLDILVKTKPCLSPSKAWEFFREQK